MVIWPDLDGFRVLQGTIFQIPTLNSGMRNAQSIGFISELAKNNVGVAQEIYRCKENFGAAMIWI